MAIACPWDTCNYAFCNKDGCIGACTEKACLINMPNKKDEHQLCSLKLNNCKHGLKCFKREDTCNNHVGKCVRIGFSRI